MEWREAEREFDHPVIGMSTIPALFEDAAARHGDRPAQQYKGGVYDRSLVDGVLPAAPAEEFRALSYAELREIVRRLAVGFRTLGVEAGERVAIAANTRMEWAQTDFAVLAAGGVVTTVYPDASDARLGYLLDDPGAMGAIVEHGDLVERVLATDVDLEFVVSIDDLGDGSSTANGETEVGAGTDTTVLTLADVYERGDDRYDADAYDAAFDRREPDDLCSLVYTSGTTGRPKGVRLTHRNFRANVNQVYARFGPHDATDGAPSVDEHTRTVSYLPLAHVFERLAGHFLMFGVGACVAYAESPDTLQEDFSLVSPTTATSVPRVYEKIYDAIREQASESALKRRIFEWAVDVGRAYDGADDPGVSLRTKASVADRLVFSQVKTALGGEIEFLISGGGSLSPELCALYHGMGLPVLEGYGLTETAPVVTANPPAEPKVGTIGPPLVDVDVRIDGSAVAGGFEDREGTVGELLVSGPNVTDGYWNQPEETEASFTDDGWFRTGDVVHQRPDGYLEFEERTKQIIVLSTGKNVAPGPIEDAFSASDVVEQCLVIGDGRKFVAALLVPNVDGIRSWADREGIDLPEDTAALCADERVRERIAEDVERVNENLDAHETIKRFRLVPVEFTEANDLLTPTMKKKRSAILSRFEQTVEELYADDGTDERSAEATADD